MLRDRISKGEHPRRLFAVWWFESFGGIVRFQYIRRPFKLANSSNLKSCHFGCHILLALGLQPCPQKVVRPPLAPTPGPSQEVVGGLVHRAMGHLLGEGHPPWPPSARRAWPSGPHQNGSPGSAWHEMVKPRSTVQGRVRCPTAGAEKNALQRHSEPRPRRDLGEPEGG